MATKSIAWNTGSGNITLTYQGQGDGTITVNSDENNLGSARSQVITVQTVGGAITRNLTVSQAACPFPVGDVKTYSYTGSYQEVELPAGQYKLQCWGAQGGSNAAASSYSITAKAGGKGGYSEGIITLSQKTTVRVYVGGQGSSSAGGFNGGGSTTGSSSYNSSSENGVSRMGGGGGATDIRLSDGALLSRMIVAGGGSGGAMCYRSKTTTSTKSATVNWVKDDHNGKAAAAGSNFSWSSSGGSVTWSVTSSSIDIGGTQMCLDLSSYVSKFPITVTFKVASSGGSSNMRACKTVARSAWDFHATDATGILLTGTGSKTITLSDTTYPVLVYYMNDNKPGMSVNSTKVSWSETTTTTSTDYSTGKVGGGTSGGGQYPGTQSAGGNQGTFGQGQAMSTTGYRYCSGAGGGGWYGGGSAYSDSTMSYVGYSGGGSGWVNIAANAQYRPTGYTSLQLDSGSTTAGSSSFPNTAGTGNETGHSGNGYAKITRLS